ncbi:MAG TPA: ankyrin repeat domain-containing protein [Terriglobales bacterium]|jgi:ankyrin repeat protein|nr:ankyrin repeat domain-containing protein [Terriglobales bacterium]
MNPKLKAIIDKYRTCPEFFTIELLDVNQRGNTGDTLVHVAAVNEEVDDIALLVACGAQVNTKGDLGNTPLHQVSSMGRVKSVKKLLQLGADPTIKNEFGETALDLAEFMKRDEVTKLLKDHISGRRT